MTDDNLKAVEKAIVGLSKPALTANNVVDLLDKVTALLEQAKGEVEEVRRRLSLIQRSIGDQ